MPTPSIALASLSIKDFRGIESLELDFHGPDGNPNQLVVLAGPNGCGKTAVLEAGLLAASWSEGSNLVTGPTDRRAIRYGSKLYRIRAQIQVHGQEKASEVVFPRPMFQPRHGLAALRGEQERQESEVVVASPMSQPLPMYEKRPVWYFSSWRVPALVGPVDATVGKRGHRPARNDRNGLLNVKQLLVNIATIERFDDRLPHLGRYSEIMPVINEAWREFYPERDESFSVEVVKSEEPAGGSFDVYLRTSEGFLLEVDLLSAGQLELFLFLSALALNKNREGIVFIDEPELHLDPQWHRSILRCLMKLQPHAQFMVATHSPEIYDEARSYERHFLVLEDDPRAQIWRPVKPIGAGA